MSRRRQLAMKLRHSHYVRHELGLSGFCVYCAQYADSLDHVPPISLAVDLPLPDFLDLNPSLLPCCRHCNSIIGDSPSLSLTSRREIVSKYLEKRYPSLLKAGALLENAEFSLSDFRSKMAFQVFKRWQFASTTFIEVPTPEPEEINVESDDAEGPGEPNTKDCFMPFPLWCNSWQISDARRIFWQDAMPEDLRDGLRILNIEKDRDLIERLTAEIPEWATQKARSEANRIEQKKELAAELEKKQQINVATTRSTDGTFAEAELEPQSDVEEYSLVEDDEVLIPEDDDEFSRALSALVLRNASGPDSIGFGSRRNIREISDILQLNQDALEQLLQIKNREKLYRVISERVVERLS